MKLLAVLLMLALGQSPKVVKVERSPDGRSEKNVLVMTADEQGGAPKGWLGVSLGNVPESLATQLDVEKGVLILNVVKGSPADEAGLEPHDIIISIGGQEIGEEVGDAVKIIGAKEPGDGVQFVVLRDGAEKKVSAKIGERPAGQPQAFAWKIEAAPDAEVEDQVRTRGRFMFKSPEGDWVMRDLGDLPDDVKMLMPDAESRNVQVFVENGEKRIRTTVQRDGDTLTVEQDGEDGPITVSRTDADGETSSETYDSEDELEEEDEEAYDVLQGTGTGTFQFRLNPMHGGDFDFDIDVDDALQWHSQFDMEELHESLQRAQEAYHEALEQFQQLHGGAAGAMPMAVPHVMRLHGGKPRQSFEVRTDGTIEVRVRKGDSELVKLYSNENDLKRREPELYQKYIEIMDEE